MNLMTLKFKTFFLCMGLFFASCSSLRSGDDFEQQSQSWPQWVSAPSQVEQVDCRNEYLCTVGEGASLSSAQAQARVEMSKIFRVQVESKQQHQRWESGRSGSSGLGEVYSAQSFYRELQELTKEVLEGVQIIKHFRDDQSYFALAALNKFEARRKFSHLLDQRDQELIRLKSLATRFSLFEARRVWLEREEIHQKMQVLSYFRQAPIDLVDIQKQIEALEKSQVLMEFVGEDQKMQRELERFLSSQLHYLGFSVLYSDKDGQGHEKTQRLEYDLSWEELSFNVEGFQRYRFKFKLETFEGSGEKESLGSLELSIKENARSFDQAYERAIQKVREHIVENIFDLNFR